MERGGSWRAGGEGLDIGWTFFSLRENGFRWDFLPFFFFPRFGSREQFLAEMTLEAIY